jgi:hypothetical protein
MIKSMRNPATLESEAPTKILDQKTFLRWVIETDCGIQTVSFFRIEITKEEIFLCHICQKEILPVIVKAIAKIVFAKAKRIGRKKSPNPNLKVQIPFQMPPARVHGMIRPVGWAGMYKGIRTVC